LDTPSAASRPETDKNKAAIARAAAWIADNVPPQFPQGLKPKWFRGLIGAAEATPLQNRKLVNNLGGCFGGR
jgi:hypothetical protein